MVIVYRPSTPSLGSESAFVILSTTQLGERVWCVQIPTTIFRLFESIIDVRRSTHASGGEYGKRARVPLPSAAPRMVYSLSAMRT